MNKKVIAVFLGIFLLTGVASAQTDDTLPSAGITPENPFYFLDLIGEAISEFFAFSAEAKVRVKTARAAERVAEIRIILREKGVEARGLAVAQERLKKHLDGAALIIERERGRGKDISALAREIVDKFHAQRVAALKTFRSTLDDFHAKKDALLIELRAAVQAGDIEEAERIRQALADLEGQKDEAEKLKEDTINSLRTEKERLHENLKEERREEVEDRDRDLENEERAKRQERVIKERAQENEERAREREIEARKAAREREEEARRRGADAEQRARQRAEEAREVARELIEEARKAARERADEARPSAGVPRRGY